MSAAFRLPPFYPVIDTGVLDSSAIAAVQMSEVLIRSGVRILQYRHKPAWEQRHYDEAAAIALQCEQAGVLFVLNDRADFAKLLRSGLHIGQEDLPVAAARKVIGDEVIGFSTHNRAQLGAADRQAVEYLSIGPIYATASKVNPDPVVGLVGIRQARALTQKPLCAIGGVNLANAEEVLQAGADSVAVLSGLLPHPGCGAEAVRARAAEWLAVTASAANRS